MVEEKLLDVTKDKKDYQLIKFYAESSLIVVVNHDGKKIMVLDA